MAEKRPPPANIGTFPKEFLYIGLVFSIALIVTGMFVMVSYPTLYAIGALTVCLGFGIAIGIFGGYTTGKFLTFTLAGCGATAIALYILIAQVPLQARTLYLVGDINGTADFRSVRGEGKRKFLVGQTARGTDFRFAISEDEIGSNFVTFRFDPPEGYRLPNGDEIREFTINCINARDLKDTIDQQESLSLEAGSGGEIRLIGTSRRLKFGQMNALECSIAASGPPADSEVSFLSRFSAAAFAQGAAAIDIPRAVAGLDSDDGYQRDFAREQLASLRGADAYAAMLDGWTVAESSYRADLGRLVAWSAAIGQDRATAVTLAEALSPQQLRYLVQMTGQGDITMRQYATELLHRLLETTSWDGGPGPDRAQQIVATTLSGLSPDFAPLPKAEMAFRADNLLYNTIVAIGFAECNIGKPYRQQVEAALAERGRQLAGAPKTRALLDKVVAGLRRCP